jgi:peptidoglycan/LPS O-acetylase OafA/YrhL
LSKAGVESAVLAFTLSTLLAWVAAEISFRVFETPFLRLKDRFRRHPGSGEGGTAPVLGPASVAGGTAR